MKSRPSEEGKGLLKVIFSLGTTDNSWKTFLMTWVAKAWRRNGHLLRGWCV